MEEELETWIVVFEMHGLKISITKTEALPRSKNETETIVKLVESMLMLNCLQRHPSSTSGHCSRAREMHRLMSIIG